MKLSSVFLVIFFSGILLVGVVSDISAYDYDHRSSWTAIADAHRYGIIEGLPHVRLYATVESDSFSINSYYTMRFNALTPAGGPGEELKRKTQKEKFGDHVIEVDGAFYDYMEDRRRFEERGCQADARITGERTNGDWDVAMATDGVGVRPPANPPDRPILTATLSPAVGSNYFATAGSTHKAVLTTSLPYHYVDWYVKAPGDASEKGTIVETDSGDTIQTVARLIYTFPAGVAGEYTITAVIREGQAIHKLELSYNVTVTLPPGIYPTNTVAAGASPGSPYELKVITDESFYWIDWYVKQSDEAGLGTLVESDLGGTFSEATMTYTYNVIGDYVITAVIWRGSDMSRYEETYNLRCDS